MKAKFNDFFDVLFHPECWHGFYHLPISKEWDLWLSGALGRYNFERGIIDEYLILNGEKVWLNNNYFSNFVGSPTKLPRPITRLKAIRKLAEFRAGQGVITSTQMVGRDTLQTMNQEAPIIPVKELLKGAAQLKGEEIGEAVAKAVKIARNLGPPPQFVAGGSDEATMPQWNNMVLRQIGLSSQNAQLTSNQWALHRTPSTNE